MIEVIDHLIIAVKNLEIAENNFIKLLGFNPVWQGSHEDLGTSNSIFLLRNTYLELLTANGEGAGAELVKNFLKKHGDLFWDNLIFCDVNYKAKGYQTSTN